MDQDGQLSTDQQIMLDNFMNITGIQDRTEAINLLSSFSWHFEEAVLNALSDMDSATYPELAGSDRQQQVQPRQNEPLRPNYLSSIWRYFAFESTQSAEDTNSQTLRFIRQYESLYGHDHPEFFVNSYARAVEKAKRDLLFLLVYIHSPEHDKSVHFCKNVLNSPLLASFLIERRFLTWAGSVEMSDGYSASDVLQASAFPFLGLICMKNSAMQLVHKIEGADTVESVLVELESALNTHGHHLIAARAQREEQDLNRNIRQQQEDAYEQSLRKDREKERLRREADEYAKKEEEERIKREQEAEKMRNEQRQEKERIKQRLQPEPSETETNVTKIVFRLPDGTRLARRFFATDKIERLYEFISTRDLHTESEDVVICSNFPRRAFSDKSMTLQEAGLVPNGMVIVEEVYQTS